MTTIWVNTIRLIMGEVRVIEEVIDTLGNTNGVELFKILGQKIQYNGGTGNFENIVYVQMIDSQRLMKLGMSISRDLQNIRRKRSYNSKILNDFLTQLLTLLTSSVYINNIGSRSRENASRAGFTRGHNNRTPSISSSHEITRTILTSSNNGPDAYLPDNRLVLRNVLYQLKLCMIVMLESLQSMESQEDYDLLEPQISSFLFLVNATLIDKLYLLFKQLDKKFVLNTEKFIHAITKG